MWAIYEKHSVEKQLKKLPKEMRKRYEIWKDIVRISGPAGLRKIKGFHDEKLKGKWEGHRSSRLSDQFRIIYFVKGNEFYVKVIKITPHDYRR